MKAIRLTPGGSIGETCSTCGWELHVYFKSRTYAPGEHMPQNPPMWWQTVCLCGWKTYEQKTEPVQHSLLEAA